MSSLDGRKRIITRHIRDRRHTNGTQCLCRGVPGTLLSCHAVSTDQRISAHPRPCDHHEDVHIEAISKPWYFLVAPSSRMTTAKPSHPLPEAHTTRIIISRPSLSRLEDSYWGTEAILTQHTGRGPHLQCPSLPFRALVRDLCDDVHPSGGGRRSP